MTRRPSASSPRATIPCVVTGSVPVEEICAFLNQALAAAPFGRRNRWWRVEVGEVVVINEPEGRIWIMREQAAAELNVYFDLPDDFLGHTTPERIMRSWQRSLGETIPEDGARGQELMQGVTRCAELLTAIGVAAGLPDVDSWCGSSCDRTTEERFVLTSKRYRVPLPPTLKAFLEGVSQPFRRLRSEHANFVDDGMIMTFRTPENLGPVLLLRLIAELPSDLVSDFRDICRREGLIADPKRGQNG